MLVQLMLCFIFSNFLVITHQQYSHVTEYKGYMNAWIVKFRQDENDQDYIKLIHVCKHNCDQASMFDTEIVDCRTMQGLINASQWYHYQLNAWSVNDWTNFCNNVKDDDVSWKSNANVVVASGMYILQPFSVQINNKPEALASFAGGNHWLEDWKISETASLQLTLRITHIFAHASKFAVYFTTLVVNVPKPRQQLITTGVQSACRQLGYVAPQYSHLYHRYMQGKTQCVWECLVDTLRQPFNAPPPALEETSNKTCVRVPVEFMAVVFGFTLETQVAFASVLDLNEDFFESLDNIAKAMSSVITALTQSTVLTALQIPGSMQSVGSFMDRLESMQAYRGALYSWQYSTNQNFAHTATTRRLLGSHVSDLHVQGLVVTAVNTSVHDVWLAIQNTVVSQTASLPASLKVVGVLDVDLGLAVTVNKKLVEEPDDSEFEIDSRAELWKNLLPLLVAASVAVSLVLVAICKQYAGEKPKTVHLRQSLSGEES
jgi:hypothetical protein